MVKKFLIVIAGVGVLTLAVVFLLRHIISSNAENDLVVSRQYKIKQLNEQLIGAVSTQEGLIYLTQGDSIKLYFVKSGEQNSSLIFEDKKNGNLVRAFAYNETFIIIKADLQTQTFEVVQYGLEKQKSIFFGEFMWFPKITIEGKDVFLCYSDSSRSYVYKLGVLDGKNEMLIETLHKHNKGRYSGRIILDVAKRNEDSLYFQIVDLNNEFIDSEGIAYLAEFSIKGKALINWYQLERKLLYFSVLNNHLLLSEYDSEEPLEESGVIAEIESEKIVKNIVIPGVFSGNDIIDSTKKSEVMYFYTPKTIYAYDGKEKKILKQNVRENRRFIQEGYFLSFQDDFLVYTTSDEGGTNIYFFELEASFYG